LLVELLLKVLDVEVSWEALRFEVGLWQLVLSCRGFNRIFEDWLVLELE